MRCPFCVFKRKTEKGAVWYARFWDDKAGKYAVTRSTGIIAEGKKERRREAMEMLSEVRFGQKAPEKPMAEYLTDFWRQDSPYAKECALIRKRPLSAYYVEQNAVNVLRYVKTFPGFEGLCLRELNSGLIRDWMVWMAEREGAAGRMLSGRRINAVVQTVRVAVRYAVDREELERDPFRSVKQAEESIKEKGVLTPGEVAKLIVGSATDSRRRLAILLGTLCGMRMGEIRGLRWGDIGDGLIHIRNNWINGEGSKAPKCKGGNSSPKLQNRSPTFVRRKNAGKPPPTKPHGRFLCVRGSQKNRVPREQGVFQICNGEGTVGYRHSRQLERKKGDTRRVRERTETSESDLPLYQAHFYYPWKACGATSRVVLIILW